jgi:hypothetical protein
MDRSELLHAVRRATECVQDILQLLANAEPHVAPGEKHRLRLARAHALGLGDELIALAQPSLADGRRSTVPLAPLASVGCACEPMRCSCAGERATSIDHRPAYLLTA